MKIEKFFNKAKNKFSGFEPKDFFNNDRIKFRAWDKINQTIFFPLSLEFNEKNELIYIGLNPSSLGVREYDEIVLMQYTGEKDKNGKEIYEGDFIRKNFITALVVWDEDHGKFVNLELEFECDKAQIVMEKSKKLVETEIIGNIFENQELWIK